MCRRTSRSFKETAHSSRTAWIISRCRWERVFNTLINPPAMNLIEGRLEATQTDLAVKKTLNPPLKVWLNMWYFIRGLSCLWLW